MEISKINEYFDLIAEAKKAKQKSVKDPFSKYLKGQSRLSKWVKKAREQRLSDAAIKAGIDVLKHEEKKGVRKKYKTSIDDLLAQLPEKDFGATDDNRGITKTEHKETGQTLGQDLIDGAKELFDAATDMAQANYGGEKKFAHQLDLPSLKKTLKTAWVYLNAARKKGYDKDVRIDKDSIHPLGDLANQLSQLLVDIRQHLHEKTSKKVQKLLKDTSQEIDKLRLEKILFPYPDKPLTKPSDLDQYFREIKANAPKEKARIKQYRKRAPERMKKEEDKTEKINYDDIMKESAKSIIPNIAKNIKRGEFGGVDDEGVEELIHKKSKELINKKLPTGTTIKKYLSQQLDKGEEPENELFHQLKETLRKELVSK